MAITFNCTNCGQHYVIDQAGAGTSVYCPKCKKNITVPKESQCPPEKPERPTNYHACPKCNSKLGERVLVCHTCGYELVTGQKTAFNVEAASSPKPRSPPNGVAVWNRTGKDFLEALGIAIFLALIVVGIPKLYIFVRSNTPLKPKPVLEQFQDIVAKHEVLSLHECENYSYDVRQTDSLVSPYMGIVNYHDIPQLYHPDYEVTFAYQDGEWVAKNWRYRDEYDGREKWHSSEEFRKDYPDKNPIGGWNSVIEAYYTTYR